MQQTNKRDRYHMTERSHVPKDVIFIVMQSVLIVMRDPNYFVIRGKREEGGLSLFHHRVCACVSLKFIRTIQQTAADTECQTTLYSQKGKVSQNFLIFEYDMRDIKWKSLKIKLISIYDRTHFTVRL